MDAITDTHDHRHHEGESLSVAAEKSLREAGERWTEMRALIFGILADYDRAASAYEIAERASAARGKTIAPNSVYRILDLFVANNLAKRIETANAYTVNTHPGCVHDCIFLICQNCDGVTHIDNDPLAREVREAADSSGFVPHRPVIEIMGLCADCAKEQA